MKDFILCRQQITGAPFFPGAHQEALYTLEELNYYMQGHLFLLDEEFFSDDLFSWIQNDLDMPALASSLRGMKIAQCEVSDMTRKVFDASGLYDREELSRLNEMIVTLQDKSAVERQVIYGDYLLSEKEYREALSVYLDLKKDGRFSQMSEALQKRVIYHTGVIYARFLLFSEAYDHFSELWEQYEDAKGQEAICMLMTIAKQEGIAFSPDPEHFMPDDEDMEAAEEKLDRLMKDPAQRTAQNQVKDALAESQKKDAWIQLLFKKYNLVDSL